MFHLVFMILIMPSANSLQEAEPCDQYLSLHALHNLRKKKCFSFEYKYSSMRVTAFQCHGRIYESNLRTSHIFGPHHVALEPLGVQHWCQHLPPCSQRAAQAVARVLEHHGVQACSFQLPQLCHSLHKCFSTQYS